jgi:ABC-type amino acid transport substrate-binding protein
MKNIFYALLIASCLCHPFLLRAQEVVKLGRMEQRQGPVVLSDIAESVVSEACRRNNIKVEFIPVPPLRSAVMADNGELDGELIRVMDFIQAHPNRIRISTPVSRVDIALYSLHAEDARLTRDELAKRTTAIARGIFAVNKHTASLSPTEASSLKNAFMMLENKRVEQVIFLSIETDEYLRTAGLQGIYKHPVMWVTEPLYVSLNKRHTELADKLNKTLSEMQKEGLIEKIYNDYLKKIHREK